jgi:predicted dehydrogenase
VADQYRFGILGAGAVAGLHARAIRDLDDAVLVAASRRTESKGRAFAEQHDCTWHPDPGTLLDDEAPDVVTIATPSGAHLSPALAALKRGVHVLCEKPLEITTDRVDRMIETARVHNVKLGGIFQRRYGEAAEALYEAAAQGRFGSLAAATASVPWWREDTYYNGTWKGTRELDGGGALMNQSIHAVDAIQWIAGAAMDLEARVNPVAEVYAHTALRGHDPAQVEVEDTAVAVLKFRNGPLGHLLGTTAAYPGSERRLRVAGRDGTAEVLGDRLVQWQFRHEQPQDRPLRDALGNSSGDGGASDPMAIDYALHKRNLRAFLDWMDRDADFGLDGPEARKAVEVIEAIYASAEQGAPISL